MESVVSREEQLYEFSEFVEKKLQENVPKTSNDSSGISHLSLICGDFNISPLPETEDIK